MIKIFKYWYSKLNKLLQYNLIIVIFWISLYNFGFMTERRLLVFAIILIWICIYKILCKHIKENNIICSENILYILLWIDYFKLFIINILIIISIKLYEYDLKIYYENNYIIKRWILLVFENLIINPLKLVLYKYYNVLYNWKTTPILEIFFKRIYGSVLGILIFSNIIGYLWYLLNYSLFNLYLVLLVINLIDEISKTEKYDDYSIFYYIKFFNFKKDLMQIVEHRSLSSVFALYIQKALQNANIGYKPNKIKSFAFSIYLYFNHTLDYIIVISLKKSIQQRNFNKLKLTSNSVNLLHWFYVVISMWLDSYISLLIELEYLKIQQLTSIELQKVKDLEEFMLLVIKMLLYYLWDFENIDKDVSNYNFMNLYIDEISSIYSKYNYLKKDLVKPIIKYINKNKIHFFHIHRNMEFYEQFYLYANLLKLDDKTYLLDFENYKNLENYAGVFLSNLSVLSLLKRREPDDPVEKVIFQRFNNYKESFIEEWKTSQKLDLETRNFLRLKELNEFIIKKIKE